MKERFRIFLKANKKKIIAFILSGIIAILGLSSDEESVISFVNMLTG